MSTIPTNELNIVRDLAKQVAELAQSEEYEKRRKRWRDVNELRTPDRAPVWCRPAGVWPELLPDEALQCTDPACRSVEGALRRELIKDAIGDDHIINPWWEVNAAFDCSTPHLWGLPTHSLTGSTDLGGWRYEPPIKQPEDFDKVTLPEFTYNAAATEARVAAMHDLIGDIFPVQVTCSPTIHTLFNVYVDHLRGLGEMMLDLYVQPERIHRLMAKLLEACLRNMRYVEECGLLTPNNHGGMMECDPINGNPPPGQVRLHNLWGVTNSQEFDEVSPAMWEEFLLNYQKPALQQFGRVQYGCCEDLTQKVRGVLSIPNLRVFVCSFWTNLDTVLEAVEDRYCVMWRQSAAEVTLHPDLSAYERYLNEHMPKLRGHFYQVVLREIETLDGHPDRLREWAQLTIRKAEENA